MNTILQHRSVADAATQQPIGIVAGSGDLPKRVIAACKARGQKLLVIGFEGETDPVCFEEVPHLVISLTALGKGIKALRNAGIQQLVMIGRVGRPNLSLKDLDFTSARLLLRVSKIYAKGDNTILQTVLEYLEEKGFSILGVENVVQELLAPIGVLGTVQPDDAGWQDLQLAARIARLIGNADIGQGAVVQHGVVLGVEAIEGTDALLERCGKLRQNGPGGVLVKMKKPHQEARVDLPTIGIKTIENAHKAGLRGIGIEAGAALIIDREAVTAAADAKGMFVVGLGE